MSSINTEYKSCKLELSVKIACVIMSLAVLRDVLDNAEDPIDKIYGYYVEHGTCRFERRHVTLVQYHGTQNVAFNRR